LFVAYGVAYGACSAYLDITGILRVVLVKLRMSERRHQVNNKA